jgi:glycosyltransferase involved in cell wall biosynthesis
MAQPEVSLTDVAARRAREPGARPRVLTVIDRVSDYGGAERFAVGLALQLHREHVDSWLCTTRASDDGALAVQLAAAGIPNVVLGRRGKWDVHRLGGLLALLRRERFDVVHSHMFGSNVWSSVLGRACGVPVVLAQEHTWSYTGNPLRMWVDGHVIGRLATRFIAVSPLDAQRMVELEHVPPEKVVFIPTAYIPRVTGAPVATLDLRAELGLEPGTPLVGVAAVLRPQKALSVLLDAHLLVVERVPHAHLVIAGDGECREALVAQAGALGIAERVHFLGPRKDVEAIIANLDIAALSSDFEGLPLFAIECMTHGTPLVATDVGGLSEIVRDGVNGLLVPARDPRALADALCGLLSDRDRLAMLATAAASSADAYSIEAVAERFATLYGDLLAVAHG